VHANTLLKVLLTTKQVLVQGFAIEAGGLVLFVCPSWRKPRCSGCGGKRSGYDTLPPRDWRHLDFGGVRVTLRYPPRRVNCKRCGVVVERVPWSEVTTSRFTTAFEEAVAFLTQRCDQTSVTELFRIAWATVGSIAERVLARHRSDDPFAGLHHLGVDELSFRKGQRYLTLVTNHATRRIIWAKEGKSAETLQAFFSELGPERCQQIRAVSMDMSQAFIKAVRESLPHAQIVFDRFHVQRLVNDALDATRRAEWNRAKAQGPEAAQEVKGLRWPLLKNPWNLTPTQSARLSSLPRENQRLYRAYLLKEAFAEILDRRQPNVVHDLLTDWLSWASHSKLPAFVKVARTIRLHLDDIVAYVRWRLTNGVVEGLNNKARVLMRRAYGFHSASAAIGMIMLCCSGIVLRPPGTAILQPT
jgi:transposase